MAFRGRFESKYRLVRLHTEEEFVSMRQIEEQIAHLSKYRSDLTKYAVFRLTPRTGWVCWMDPSDLQQLVDGELDIEWDDVIWDDDEEEL